MSAANFTPYGVSGTTVTGTETYYSAKTSLKRLTDPSYQLFSDGTMTGTHSVWVSNKPAPSEVNDADWVQLTLAVAITQPAGADTKEFVDLSGLSSPLWIRLKYVNASGDGVVYAWFNGKGS